MGDEARRGLCMPQREYVESGGTVCPVCGEKSNMEDLGFELGADGQGYYQTACLECGSVWYDRYALVGYEIKSLPRKAAAVLAGRVVRNGIAAAFAKYGSQFIGELSPDECREFIALLGDPGRMLSGPVRATDDDAEFWRGSAASAIGEAVYRMCDGAAKPTKDESNGARE